MIAKISLVFYISLGRIVTYAQPYGHADASDGR